jgi:hypothetical protein
MIRAGRRARRRRLPLTARSPTADAQIDRELYGLNEAEIALVEALPGLREAPSHNVFESPWNLCGNIF